MHISNTEAEEKALALANSFLSSQSTQGWEWKCVGAKPDLTAENSKDRKIYIKWSVLVEWSKSGSILDGPSIVLVDIEKEECAIYE
ncbi:hypothetical protein [Pseudomonas subflava]|uniref:hypothetical protein n=1 Tax=Pseudomonas subflava TaxID=2952933 RepID=UPI0020793E35|nr:hypothetical protein [Pseudomonas subflava]